LLGEAPPPAAKKANSRRNAPLRGRQRSFALKSRRGKSIAIGHLAALISPRKPTLALFGRAVRKGVRIDALSGIALQGIIADLAGCIHRLVQITAFERVEFLLHRPRPNAGKAIGLEYPIGSGHGARFHGPRRKLRQSHRPRPYGVQGL